MQTQTKEIRSPGSHGISLARNSLLTFFGYAVPTLVGIVTIPLIIKGLGTERFGVLSLVWLVLGYLGAFDLGLGRAVTRYISDALHRSDGSLVRRLIWTATLVQAPIGFVTGAGLALLAPWLIGDLLKLREPLASEALQAFYLLALSMPICQQTAVLRGVLEAFERFDLSNLIKLPAGVASFVLPLVGLWLNFSLPGIVLLVLLARVAALIAHIVFCFRLDANLRGRPSVDMELFGPLFRFGGWTTVSTLAQQLQLYLERLLVGGALGMTAVAHYSVPSDMITRMVIIPLSIGTALFPGFSASNDNARERIVPLSARSLKYLLVILTPITTVAFVFAPDILRIWLGQEFAMAASTCARILVVCFLLNAVGYVPYTVIHGQGRPEWKAKLDLVELPAFVLLSYLLLPRFGLAGVATAKLLIQLLDLCALFVMAKRLLHIRPLELFSQRCGEASIMAGALTAAAFAVTILSTNIVTSATLVLVGLAAYFLLTWKLVIDERDRIVIAGARRSFHR